MRNMILGTVAGLLVGSIGAFAYNQYLGAGSLLADLQAQLDATKAQLAKAQSDQKFTKEQYDSETEQLNQVLANKQADSSGGDKSGAAAAPAATPLTIGGMQITPDMVRGFMSMMGRGGPGGGFRSPEQRMLVMQNRLKLTPDQSKAIKDAMTADEQARRDAFRQARQSGQPPDLSGANSLDRTLSSVLSPSQQVQYQQLQGDEKAARAESSATSQVDNLMPLLQLTDDQKGKAMAALYQQQLSAPDPVSIANNPNPLGAISQQGQAIQAAMKQVLTPDQYALYQQSDQLQQQAFANFGGGRRRNNNGGNGNGGPGQAQGGGPGGPGGATVAANPTGSTPTGSPTGTTTDATGTTTASTTGTTTDATASTNAPSATTNAAPADGSAPPPPPPPPGN